MSSWELLKLRLEILNKLPNQTIMDYLRNQLTNEDLLKLLPSDILDQKRRDYDDLKSMLEESLQFGKGFAPLIQELEERMKSNLLSGFNEWYSKLLDSFGTYSDNVNRHLAEITQEIEALDMLKEFTPLLKATENRLKDEISLLASVVMKIKKDLSAIKMNEETMETKIQNGFNDFLEKFLDSRKRVDGNIDAIHTFVAKLDCSPRSQIVSLKGNLHTGFKAIESQLLQLKAFKEEEDPYICNDQDYYAPINTFPQNGTTICGINESPGLVEQITTFSLTEDGLVKLCIFILTLGQLLSWFSKVVRYVLISSNLLWYIHITKIIVCLSMCVGTCSARNPMHDL